MKVTSPRRRSRGSGRPLWPGRRRLRGNRNGNGSRLLPGAILNSPPSLSGSFSNCAWPKAFARKIRRSAHATKSGAADCRDDQTSRCRRFCLRQGHNSRTSRPRAPCFQVLLCPRSSRYVLRLQRNLSRPSPSSSTRIVSATRIAIVPSLSSPKTTSLSPALIVMSKSSIGLLLERLDADRAFVGADHLAAIIEDPLIFRADHALVLATFHFGESPHARSVRAWFPASPSLPKSPRHSRCDGRTGPCDADDPSPRPALILQRLVARHPDARRADNRIEVRPARAFEMVSVKSFPSMFTVTLSASSFTVTSAKASEPSAKKRKPRRTGEEAGACCGRGDVAAVLAGRGRRRRATGAGAARRAGGSALRGPSDGAPVPCVAARKALPSGRSRCRRPASPLHARRAAGATSRAPAPRPRRGTRWPPRRR